MARINETRKRSLLKAVSFRIIEITATTLALHFGLGEEWSIAIGWAVVLETMCLILHYGFERMFDRVQWGRYFTGDKDATNR